ncbi:DUF5666 domain-containing protein [Marinobacter sp. HL-58]|uniref:DUF5666 domain-containing protein n=1 Tax=Marinobacter sp. HL-58 TaxID=1479237 RepID=UPI00048378BC|nr:DUF5666 domain-containing protein [Marinobacter sp. HL-58]KPP98724.1 MAG: hypothetical protein HLUCCO03_17510 [Marinobacter sp. HL-58]
MNPTSIQSVARFSLSALTIGILTACGGGGGSDGLDIADGGIRGTGSSVGPVSGFGSVFVNGVRFDTDDIPNRAVNSDDGIGFESELDEGMILRVDGEWRDDGTGEAASVEYDDTLRGEIVVTQPWDIATKTATVSMYGLIVHVDKQTVVKGKQVTELADDDFARISAWRLPNGEFRASLVRVRDDAASEVFDPENEIELEGEIANLNRDLCTFEIGNISVECDSDGDTNFDGIDISDLADGTYIQVEGNFNDNVLFAREIREDDLRRYRRGDDDDIEFAGPVSRAFDSGDRTFEINGLVVRVTSETEFDDGLSEDDLVPDLLIQVEGEFLSDGTVEADEIELREGESEVEGRIAANSVNTTDQTFRIGGVLVQVTPLTAVIGDDDPSISFQQLGGPEEVEVSGIERVTADGNVYLEAFKIEVDDDVADDQFELVGGLRRMDNNGIDVLGVSIRFGLDTEFDTSQSELQSLADQGEIPLVEVSYQQNSNGILFVDEIELEEDDDD